jgi:hypothetical protein
MPTPHRSRRKRPGASLAAQVTELAIAAPQVVAHRVARMAVAGPRPSARDQKEFTRMVAEKQSAFFESWAAMASQAVAAQQALALSAWKGWMTVPKVAMPGGSALARQWQGAALGVLGEGLKPVHRKAVANAKRLAKPPAKRR